MTDKKVVLIAGASKGLGREMVRSFLEDGCSVFAVSRSLNNLRQLLTYEDVSARSSCLSLFEANICEQSSSQEIVAACLGKFGRLDFLISNAAVQGPIGNFWEQPLDAWEDALNANFLAHVRLTHAVIPAMLRNQGPDRGSLVFLSGGGATSPRPRFTSYAAAKTALVRFSETLARELEEFGIRSNSIAPGVMPTELLSEVISAGPEIAGNAEIAAAAKARDNGDKVIKRAAACAVALCSGALMVSGKLVSAPWDRWDDAWQIHLKDLEKSDVYTLRRIAGRDRDMEWGDA